MEVEENGCDVSAENEKMKLIFTSDENTHESVDTTEEIIEEHSTQPEMPKMEEVIIKVAKNIKAKNDIEDDIRMICGSEELNRSSQDKEETVDNNILETLQEQAENVNEEIADEIMEEDNCEQVNLKRSHSRASSEQNNENEEEQDLFGFYEGKFVFGKKIKVNSSEVDSEIIGPKFKRLVSNTERILEEMDTVQKNIGEHNGKLDQNGSEVSQNATDTKTNVTTLINENEEPKSSPSVSATASPIQTPSHTSHKLRPSEDPIFRKPFEMGWKREIVLRALPGSKDKGEVYYITPSGKKLRTRHEIQVNLTSGLTLDNFTFSKDALGADPEDEIIRSAKPSGRNIETSTAKISEISTPASTKRIPKPKAPKGASPPPQGWTPTQAVKTQGSRSHVRYPTTNTDDHHSKSMRTSSTSSENIGSNIKSGNSSKKGEPCTIQCVLAMGLIPQLQCVKCLCSFHHECVGLDRNVDDFQSSNTNESGSKGKKIYECDSCKAQNISKTDLNPIYDTECLTNNPKNLNYNMNQLQNNNDINEISGSVNPLTNFSNSQCNLDKSESNQKCLQEKEILCNKSFTKNSNTISNKNNISNEGSKNCHSTAIVISSKHVQSIAVLNGRKYLVIHKPGIRTSNEHVEVSTSTGSNKSSPVKIQYVDSYVHNLFGNVSGAYDIILNVFKYLKVQELLRAARVSRLWNHLANERSLWKIVRMKNSQVNDWAGFAATLSRNSTQHLDLRKMICPKSGVDKMWTNFNENIQKVFTLRTIDLGRCPASVVQNLFLATPQLNILNATSIKSETINLENLNKLSNLTELRLKSVECCNLIGDLSSFAFLTNLKHLSLTLIDDLGTKNIEILGQLTELESLEIGECSSIQQNFASDILSNLKKLQRLRLEKSTDITVTFSILEQISEMENLQQLELVNFDIRDGFEQKIIACKNLKRFLLIPTYVSQSATTNQIILSSMRKLKTLESFTWVVTLELLSVTALYVDQCGSKDRRNFNDSIPVLKPVPGASHREKQEISSKTTNADIQQIEILPLSTIKEILDDGTPNTKHKIVRVPYATTWRQAFVE
ncbi:uncharacterized protein LOC129611309 isoform X1 [Condylostylus longicornis]|uniref:uncharacterized protein LOC129611309 isoform X1 n=1 Tax=Condylostylus longicornis TaxID=2530218 RepID=UPI00244DDF6C|nr:uncharacterized protein LOC129611309 isoform X1 [Condylostylus longicornis]